jgi:hypothetical protein
MSKMTEFNTVHYCLDNNIPCFSFYMDATKKPNGIVWTDVTPTNFRNYIHAHHNGFAIITGHTHFVIDFDLKHNPPQEICDFLMERCSAIERTPGGYHFWFKIDNRTDHLESPTNIQWNSVEINGLDMRAKKGICYVSPSHYKKENTTQTYKWIKGDLSTATIVPDDVLVCIEQKDSVPDYNFENATVETFKENGKIVIKITPKTCHCLVKDKHIHSQTGHSCIYLTKLKTCYSATATCFSHGKRKIGKEACDALVEQFWEMDNENEILNEYSYMKENFEIKNFKTMNPVGFYTLINDIWVFRERAQMKTAYENMLLSDGSPFLDKWLKDPTMKTYSKVSYQPNNDPTIFVLPDMPSPQFIYKTYICESNMDALPIFNEFLDILTNKKPQIKQYIINWCAHLIQKPLELPGVGIIFIGQKGVGKDTFGDFLGNYIIGGGTYYQNYSNQLQFFDKHDTFKANKFLIKVEELSKKIFSDENNDNYFKSSFTSPTVTLNPKNGTPYEVKNYNRIIGTTNHSNALNVEQKERRYVFSVVSPEKMGNHEFWNNLRSVLFTPSGALAIAKMLEEYDITNFDPRVLPENAYLRQLQEETVDSVQKFIDQIEADDYTGTRLYQEYKDYCLAEGLHLYTNTKFATQLLFLIENGSITRHIERNRTKKGIQYIIN